MPDSQPPTPSTSGSPSAFAMERRFDARFVSVVAMREKQVQQSARPVISIHKWFARRPGSVFRSLLLAEFSDQPLVDSYWRTHDLSKVIADPFMGGGTTVYESLRLGCSIAASDINPLSKWLVREAVEEADIEVVRETGLDVWEDLQAKVGDIYKTTCLTCRRPAGVKYFLWDKVCACPNCEDTVILQTSFKIAQADRHTHEVYLCPVCHQIEQILPANKNPSCATCTRDLTAATVKGKRATCPHCRHEFAHATLLATPPEHELVCIEYQCSRCYKGMAGRQFKSPDAQDFQRFANAEARLLEVEELLPIPDEIIPAGDETDRLLRWGYLRYRDLFNARQLLSLGILANLIRDVDDRRSRHALATVFSDFLRYQNLLCRYDIYALKCQDVFAVHGFPVALSACENNVPGIEGVGSGAFIHFLEKYCAAKEYTQHPFEISYQTGKKKIISTGRHPIEAPLVDSVRDLSKYRSASIRAVPSQDMALPENSVDAILTDPPYFSNVQYAELMDFCYVWLRRLVDDEPSFEAETTRHRSEATGNATQGRGLAEFTEAMSGVYRAMGYALKPGGPLAFTYHHNDPSAYAPIVVAVLDANLTCTDVLPAPAEMAASMHINNTKSSILDSIFVCRDVSVVGAARPETVDGLALEELVARDVTHISDSDYQPTAGDIACLRAGHVAGMAIRELAGNWNAALPAAEKLALVSALMKRIQEMKDGDAGESDGTDLKALLA